ncbi:DEAD/DEAH box helicase, partial [Vibrio parahaemolyticus]|nr:DEAD/DEAH box helicase [Vibrio parahaemolyticus]
FDQLLPEKEYTPTESSNFESLRPTIENDDKFVIKDQSEVSIDKSALIDDPKALEALRYLNSIGVTGDIDELLQQVDKIPVTKVRKRQAQRQALSDRVKNATGKILANLEK